MLSWIRESCLFAAMDRNSADVSVLSSMKSENSRSETL